MANDEQEMLFDIFQAVSSQQYESINPTSDYGFNEPTSSEDTNEGLSALVSNLGANPGTSEPSSSGDVTQRLDALISGLSASQSGGGQATSGGASEVSSSPVGSAGTSEPSVINMSAETGSTLNSEPTTIAVEPYGSSGSGGSSGGGGSSILSLVSSALGGGLGMIPLVSSLLGLFGGGSSEPPPLEKYVKPDQLYFTGADTPGGVEDADYNQYGMPRLYSDATTSSTSQTGSLTSTPATGGSGSGAGSGINVTIQALDSQSFLDRSNDIAQAVRQAMLTSNSINDVVNDLQ
jgi:hypothetical protein